MSQLKVVVVIVTVTVFRTVLCEMYCSALMIMYHLARTAAILLRQTTETHKAVNATQEVDRLVYMYGPCLTKMASFTVIRTL